MLLFVLFLFFVFREFLCDFSISAFYRVWLLREENFKKNAVFCVVNI